MNHTKSNLLALALLASVSAPALAAVSPDASTAHIAPIANRVFPASCLDYPLPRPTANEPKVTGTVVLSAVTGSATDTWTYTIYRRPCEGGRSAVLIDFSDPTPANPSGFAPVYPEIGVTQSNIEAGPTFAVDPRSRSRRSIAGMPIDRVNPTLALVSATLPGFVSNEPMTISLGRSNAVPFYNASLYPDANQPLLVDGYVAGSWFDPAHAGEGILFEAGEQNNQPFVFFAWFTYDEEGRPYWLTGNTTVTKTARTVTVPTLLFEGGGFAGAFGSTVPSTPWGNVTFTFLDCNNVRIDYQSTHGLAGRPAGSGTRTWTRLTQINGLACR